MSRNFKIKIVFSLSLLLIFTLAAGCGTALKESGGDQTGSGDGIAATAEYVGLDNCYTCHNQTKFGKWMDSRHANFEPDDLLRVDYTTMQAPGSTYEYGYDEIDGDPNRASCDPCHTGADDGGTILDINWNGDVFVNPNIGQISRPVISCEACHGGGSLHYGVGALPYPQPAFDQCTNCHDFNEDDDGYGHHIADSYRYWANAAGDNPHEGAADADPSVASTTIASVAFSVTTLPASGHTSWGGSYAGPYSFSGNRTIRDTHFNEIWIKEDDKVTQFTVATAKLGYVNLDDDSPNTGMVNSDDDESCTASCHGAHDFDLTINNQWAAGAHNPVPEGPIIDDGGDPVPTGPANWGAVDHGGFSASCQRCHTSMGFAEMAPLSNGSTTLTPDDADGFITCNACHDGINNPTAADKHLRFTDDVYLFNNDGSVITTVDADNSAVCIYCHQGREDPSRVDGTRFRNMHYLPSASVQYAVKGYEYAGTYGTYVGQQTAHADTAGNCVGCHMEDSLVDELIGGHTFYPAYGTTDNVTTCDTAGCHSGITVFDDINAAGDWDSNGSTESAELEIAGLRTTLLAAIEAYNMNPVDSTMDVYYQAGYPYFVLSDANQSWDLPLAAAAYNWQFIYKDPGAYAHNGKYAAQLLRDSIEDLTGSAIGGTRP